MNSLGEILTEVTAVSAGTTHTVILKTDESVWSMGLNNYGEFGSGDSLSSSIPVQAIYDSGEGFYLDSTTIPISISTTTIPDGTTGSSYTYYLSAKGGVLSMYGVL